MKLPNLRYWRTIIPVSLLAITVALVARHSYPLPPDAVLLLWYSRLDPLLLLGFLRWEGSFPTWGYLPLVTVFITLIMGRVFCGWLCPVGGLLSLLQNLRDAVGLRLGHRGWRAGPPVWTQKLLPYRFSWLALLLGLLFLGSGWTLFLSPFHLITAELSRIWLHQVPWMLAGIVITGLMVFPRFWCVFICPTGLLFASLARWRRIVISSPELCSGCALCEKVCPTGAAQPKPGPTGPDCLLCGRCTKRCPAGEFSLMSRAGSIKRSTGGGSLFTRREIIRGSVALLVAGATISTGLLTSSAQPLRPPGALTEDEFLMRCSRCGRCIKACPAQCIKAMPLSSGPALFLTPVIIPREARCELTLDCQKVCPTGAISQVPIERVLMGMAEIDHTRCLGWSEGKLCLICQEQCPQQAVDSDSENRPSVLKDRCVGCGACENACPVVPAATTVNSQPQRRRT